MKKAPGSFAQNRLYYIAALLLVFAVVLAFVQPHMTNSIGRVVSANLFQCLILAVVVLFVGRLVLCWLKTLGYGRREYIMLFLFAAALAAAGMLFLYLYFRQEQDIKTYDFSLYWIRMLQGREAIADSIPEYLTTLRASLSQEYNALPAFALIPASYLFGTHYTGYCQSIFLIYYLPACFMLSLLVTRILHAMLPAQASDSKDIDSIAPAAQKDRRAPHRTVNHVEKKDKLRIAPLVFIVCFALCATSPLLLWPVVHGYLDVVGVLIIGVMLNYTLGWDGIAFSGKRNFVLAGLSLLLLLSRRWYAYYIVGFYLALGAVALIKAIAQRKSKPVIKSLALLAANLGMIAGVAIVAILLLNPAVFDLFFNNDYGAAYSAFQIMPWWQNLMEVVSYTGYLGTVCAVFGAGLLLRIKTARRIGVRLLIAAAVAAALFLLVQSMAFHQKYLIVPTVLICSMVFVGYVLLRAAENTQRVAAAGLLGLFVLNLMFAYVPAVQNLANFSQIAATSLRSYPVQNPYYDDFKQIWADLNKKTQGKAASMYMVGEGTFSPEIFRRINLPQQLDAAPFAIENSVVDLRDGFPSQLFMADYVLVTDPFTTDFIEVQQVGYQVYEMFQSDSIIETYYEIAAAYPLGDVTMTLFHKIRPADRLLVDRLKERIRIYYPNTPFVYEPNYFLALSEFEPTMGYYNFWGNELYFNMTDSAPVRFTIHDTSAFAALSFDLSGSDTGLALVVENQGGEIYRSEISVVRTNHTVDIQGSESLLISFVTEPAQAIQNASIALYFDDASLS